MPAPSSSDEFLDLVRKSGVVDEKRLASYVEKMRIRSVIPKELGKLAGQLVKDGILTRFQAEQFLQGRWKKFTIGKYKVLDRIASGGMGSVYLCEHKFMRRRAAVKVLPTIKANDPSSLERFYREARAVAALDHPNIVRAYDIDQDDDLHFLVMEYVDGSSLHDVVRKSGPLDPTRSAHYISQAALGLQHAFEAAELVHRDIKPANLIVDRGGTVKILDMGLARFFNDEDDLLTQKYDENVLGTADDLAPEQALDSHGVDIRADIYGLGATFYYCLTGRSPFGEGSVAQKLIWHQTRQPKSIRLIRPEVPESMVAVVEKMMAKDPAQRYQTPLEVSLALMPWTQSIIPPPTAAEMPQGSLAAESPSAPAANQASPPAAAAPQPAPPKPKTKPHPALPTVASSPPNRAPGKIRKDAEPASRLAPPASVSAPVKLETDPGAGQAPAVEAGESADPAQVRVLELEEQTFAMPVATAAATEQSNESLCWEAFAKETKKHSGQTDTDPQMPKKSTGRLAPLHDRRNLWWIGMAVGAVGLLVLVVVLMLALIGDTATTGPLDKGVQPKSRILYVSRDSARNAYRTIHDALRDVKPGNRIVVQDEVIDEQVELNDLRQVSLEADAGTTITWRCPAKVSDSKKLLMVSNVEELRIQGFVFDGLDKIEEIILLFGSCPGLLLENVHLRGFTRCGVLVSNCAGQSDHPVTFQEMKTSTIKEVPAALCFELNPRYISPKVNQFFRISKCRFEGPYKKVVQITDAATLKDATWSGNLVQPDSKQPAVPLLPPK